MKITREHKAGLELAIDRWNAAPNVAAFLAELRSVVSQAGAAPEQEASRGFAEVEIFMDGGHKCFRFDEYCHSYSFPVGTYILYTRPDPSEVESLRADKQYLQRTIDGMNEAHSEVVWRQSETMAILRELMTAWDNTEGHDALLDGFDRLRAFLSPQPAENQEDA